MIQTYQNQSGHTFTSLPITLVELYTTDDMAGFYVGNTVTALNGERFTILDAKCVQGRTYKITLLPVDQGVPNV